VGRFVADFKPRLECVLRASAGDDLIFAPTMAKETAA
jgi:hypothetical protein